VRASSFLFTAVALVAAVPSAGVADPAGACHCYRDRSFDAERPAAADPYILSTSRSSLLSGAFGPSKRELVQAVMTGTSPDDLWIAHWAAAKTGGDAATLLGAKATKGSWKVTVASLHKAGATTNEAILATVLAERLRTSPATVLTSVKGGGATWGALLQGLGLTPKDLDGVIRQILSR